MGFSFNINIKRKITVNGKEYGSIEEVPEEHRRPLQSALGSAENGGGEQRKITVNGVGYDSPEAMPPDTRKIYEEILRKAEAAARRTGMTLDAPRAGDMKPEGSFSGRTITALFILAGLAILIKFIFDR